MGDKLTEHTKTSLTNETGTNFVLKSFVLDALLLLRWHFHYQCAESSRAMGKLGFSFAAVSRRVGQLLVFHSPRQDSIVHYS